MHIEGLRPGTMENFLALELLRPKYKEQRPSDASASITEALRKDFGIDMTVTVARADDEVHAMFVRFPTDAPMRIRIENRGGVLHRVAPEHGLGYSALHDFFH